MPMHTARSTGKVDQSLLQTEDTAISWQIWTQRYQADRFSMAARNDRMSLPK